MAKATTAAKASAADDPSKTLQVKQQAGKSDDRLLAEVGLDPLISAMSTTRAFGQGTFGALPVTDTYEALVDHVAAFKKGNYADERAMLIGQSVALNAIFTELARRSALNMGEYVETSDRYMRLALKAQAQSRATIETLDRITNGREQTVRHVHLDNRGGQAVIAETVHTGGKENGKSNDQPHAIEDGGASFGEPLRGENKERETVPLASDA